MKSVLLSVAPELQFKRKRHKIQHHMSAPRTSRDRKQVAKQHTGGSWSSSVWSSGSWPRLQHGLRTLRRNVMTAAAARPSDQTGPKCIHEIQNVLIEVFHKQHGSKKAPWVCVLKGFWLFLIVPIIHIYLHFRHWPYKLLSSLPVL